MSTSPADGTMTTSGLCSGELLISPEDKLILLSFIYQGLVVIIVACIHNYIVYWSESR